VLIAAGGAAGYIVFKRHKAALPAPVSAQGAPEGAASGEPPGAGRANVTPTPGASEEKPAAAGPAASASPGAPKPGTASGATGEARQIAGKPAEEQWYAPPHQNEAPETANSGESGAGNAGNAVPSGGSAAAPPPPPPAPQPPPPPQPVTKELPAGSTISVRTIDPIDSSKNQTGQEFGASLAEPIRIDGEEVVPKHANARLRLVQARKSGAFSGKNELEVELVSVECQGKSFPVSGSAFHVEGKSEGKSAAKKIGAGTIIGGALGGILGGGRGAAIGAAAGAGAGTATQLATHGKQIKLESETRIDFHLDQPLSLTYMPGGDAGR
jgi:hypothetical protein